MKSFGKDINWADIIGFIKEIKISLGSYYSLLFLSFVCLLYFFTIPQNIAECFCDLSNFCHCDAMRNTFQSVTFCHIFVGK